MIVRRLGDVVCDPLMTESNQGMCSDSAGNLLNPSGQIVINPGANNPNYSTTVTATAPTGAGFLQLDPKTLALIIGAVLVLLLIRKR